MAHHHLLGSSVVLLALSSASCSSPSYSQAPPAQQEQPHPPPQPISAAESVVAAQKKYDVGTPAGPHILGPLSPELGPQNSSVIALDPNDPNLDLWRARDITGDPKREPGPFRAGGALSFFGLPIALTPDDLKAGKVDVAIVGAALDTGLAIKGAGEAPRALRALGGGGGGNVETMVNWRTELRAVDYGDAPLDRLSVERSVVSVRRLIREIAQLGVIPVIIGGDHTLEYPDVAALSEVYGKENIGAIHIDAHPDNGSPSQAHPIWYGNMVSRLVDDGWVLGKNYILVGMRTAQPAAYEWMHKNNVRYHTRAEIERDGWPAVMTRILQEASAGPKYLYISFDVDVIDPAFMPGVGIPAPYGLTLQQVYPLMRRLCAENTIAGFEIVEVNPLQDPGYTSVFNAREIANQCLTGIAMKKKGITTKNYLSPLTVSDNR